MYLVPDEERIEKRAGQLAQEFKDLVFPDDYEPGSKRKVVILLALTLDVYGVNRNNHSLSKVLR